VQAEARRHRGALPARTLELRTRYQEEAPAASLRAQDEEPGAGAARGTRDAADEEDARLLGPSGSDEEEGGESPDSDAEEDPEQAAARGRRLLEALAARGGRRQPLPVLSEAAPESEFNLPPSVASAGKCNTAILNQSNFAKEKYYCYAEVATVMPRIARPQLRLHCVLVKVHAVALLASMRARSISCVTANLWCCASAADCRPARVY